MQCSPCPLLVKLTTLRLYPQMDGLLEDWIWTMADALKSQLAQPVNVGLADWLTLAQNHYAIAVRNTRLVGQEVAALLQWLEVRRADLPSFPVLSDVTWSLTAAQTREPLLQSSQEWEDQGWRPGHGALSAASLAPLFCEIIYSPHSIHCSFICSPPC